MAIPFTKKSLQEHPRPAPGEPAFAVRQLGAKYNIAWISARGVSLGIDITYNRKRYREVICHGSETSLTEYFKLAEARVKDIKSGKGRRRTRMTLGRLVEELVLPEVESRNRDVNSFTKRLPPILKQFGRTPVADISAIDIERFLNGLARDRKGSTVNRYQAAMSRIMSVGVRLGLLDSNPCSSVLRRPEGQPRDRVLSDEELHHLIAEALRMDTFQSLSLLVALFTGLRIGSVISITREMLDADFKVLTLPVTKNGRGYRVALNAQARQILERCAKRSWNGYLFPSTVREGQHIAHPREAHARIREYIARQTGITQPWTIHDLRRTFASRQLELTGDLRLVQQSLMHSSSVVTERYCYHQNTRLADASEQTAQSLLAGHPTTIIPDEEI